VTLLLDTHAFLWFCQDDPLLSTTAKALIEDANNRKLLSVASCWEIAIKAGTKLWQGLLTLPHRRSGKRRGLETRAEQPSQSKIQN